MPILFVLLAAAGPGLEVDAVVDKVFERVAEMAAEFKDATYYGEYQYWEYDAKGRLVREEACQRRVQVKGTGKQRVEFLSVSVDGVELTGRDRERQISMLKRKGLVQDEAEMPFRLETRDDYTYELVGEEDIAAGRAWILGFEPKRMSQQTVVGQAWISEQGEILRMEFRPGRLPWVCQNTRMTLHYSEQQGYMLPHFFEMDMDLRVRLIVTLFERRLRIEDRFSDYRFNLGLPDSLFD